MRKQGSVNIIMYFPKSAEGKMDLAQRVSEVHANAAQRRIQSLNCSTSEKLKLLDAVIETARQQRIQSDTGILIM